MKKTRIKKEVNKSNYESLVFFKKIIPKHKLMLISFLYNIIIFTCTILIYIPVYSTNDDYRMNLIASGAYDGTPSNSLVFMRFPMTHILSGLYRLSERIPWYGIIIIIELFLPSCIFLYYLLYEANKKGRCWLSGIIYFFLFFFIIVKHIMFPQFTVVAGFLGVASLVLFYYIPNDKVISKQLFLSGAFAIFSASVRFKVFIMLLPFFILICFYKWLKTISSDNYDVKELLRNMIKLLSPIVVLGILVICVQISDSLFNNISRDYKEFNAARSLIYDYGTIPSYDENRTIYEKCDIDKSMYYAISARYLDFDDELNAERLKALSDAKASINREVPIKNRIFNAFSETLSQFLDLRVVYPFIFCFTILVFAISISIYKKNKYDLMFLLGLLSGIIFEMFYFCFISRVMDRLTDVLLLVGGVLTCLIISNYTNLFKKNVKEKHSKLRLLNLFPISCIVIILGCLFVPQYSSLVARANSMKDVNERLEILNSYAKEHKNNFYFYDSYDFIAASSDIFTTYDNVLNTDSLGNWTVKSDLYNERNKKYGFETSIDGLINSDKNVYFVAIGELKNGAKYVLKERYNMEFVKIDFIPYCNNNITIYMAVPC